MAGTSGLSEACTSRFWWSSVLPSALVMFLGNQAKLHANDRVVAVRNRNFQFANSSQSIQ